MAHCENEYKLDPKELAEGGNPRTMNRRNRWCDRPATTTRTPPLYPNSDIRRNLCQWCAAAWDETAAELEAESRLS